MAFDATVFDGLIDVELRVLQLLLYRNGSQHRRTKYFRWAKRLSKALSSQPTSVQPLVSSLRSCIAQLKGRTLRSGAPALHSAAKTQEILHAVAAKVRYGLRILQLAFDGAQKLRHEVQKGHFLPLTLTLLALEARILALFADLIKALLDLFEELKAALRLLRRSPSQTEEAREGYAQLLREAESAALGASVEGGSSSWRWMLRGS
eukprot:scaffold7376_cov250-Pinguiococcus_pyrenoidosus.AAC.4